MGYLYLNGSRWDGRQVIPADYVAASTRPTAPTPSGPEVLRLPVVGDQPGPAPSFLAVGYGNQLIQVVPDLVVVVITSDANRNRNDARALVDQAIIPAVTH